MNTQIVIHLLPNELDWFEWQSRQLKIGSHYLSDDDKFIIDVTLDFNFIDWETTILPKEFFLEKFDNIKSLYDWAEQKFDVDESGTCRGCNDKRRNSIRSSTSDNILYLDSDLIFLPETIKYIIDASGLIESEYYVISPQTIRMWDTTWDIITNKKYLDIDDCSYKYESNDPFSILLNNNSDVNILPLETFKFGGGWFNLFSTNLLKFIDIPDSLGPYGIDDYYVSECCNLMKLNKYDVKQYILENVIVTENNKYRHDHYSKYMKTIDLKSQFRTQAENNFLSELKNFENKINTHQMKDIEQKME